MIANGLDFLVFLRRYRGDGPAAPGGALGARGRRLRGRARLMTNEIFRPGPDGMAVRHAPTAIRCMEALREAGYRDVGDPGRWA